jgi:hypothetical protein
MRQTWVNWKAWNVPQKLWEGQKVRVWRWQVRDCDPPGAKGHWEEGVVSEVCVDLNSEYNRPLRVPAVDLSVWWTSNEHAYQRMACRPPVGILMRGNRYWLKQYCVESLDDCGKLDWPPRPPEPVDVPPLFDFTPGALRP